MIAFRFYTECGQTGTLFDSDILCALNCRENGFGIFTDCVERLHVIAVDSHRNICSYTRNQFVKTHLDRLS